MRVAEIQFGFVPVLKFLIAIFPDLLRDFQELAYQLTISNNSARCVIRGEAEGQTWNTPTRMGSVSGFWFAAAIPSEMIPRVDSGSMMPSTQRRAAA